MPAYLSVHFEFARIAADGLVRRFYNGLARGGAPFKSVLEWGCPPDMPLDEVVEWNQTKLSSGFVLGFTQDVVHDYRQILLDLAPYSHARVFIMLRGSGVGFHLIVPEAEIGEFGGAPLARLARSLWDSVCPRSIQTSGEIDAPVSHDALAKGAAPAAELFAFLDDQYPLLDSSGLIVEPLSRGRVLAPVAASRLTSRCS